MTTLTLPFETGQRVLLKNDPSKHAKFTGKVLGRGKNIFIELLYDDGTRRNVPQESVSAIDERCQLGPVEQIRHGIFGKIEDLKRVITYEKLKGTLNEVLYSMESAQIDFYPYQYKPVLKFINSPTERLLLADEVGLGKTIESGLIWMEMLARYRAKRLLVVCPKILAPKWEQELREKFLIDARHVNFNDFNKEIGELQKYKEGHSFALIVTYSSLRPPKSARDELKKHPHDGKSLNPKVQVLRELRYWDEDFPPFDLLIFDEAHYMRNSETAVHMLGESLVANARGVLCVSATPVNNSTDDLHALLSLIDKDFFSNKSTFDDLIAVNRPTVRAASLLAQPTINFENLASMVEAMAENDYVKDSLLFRQFIDIIENIEDQNPPSCDLLARAQDYAEKLNILGLYINRTRRVQVKENRAVRDPKVYRVVYTPEEQLLYREILRSVRRKCALSNSQFHFFRVISHQLMAASCLPTFAHRILDEQPIEDDPYCLYEAMGTPDDFVEESDVPLDFDEFNIRSLTDYDFEAHDSKFSKLAEILEKTKHERVVIFAYFRPTLAYLKRRIQKLGHSVALIHGNTKMEDRWAEIERFTEGDARILLASEVGSEGIDLQTARILINYDMPWNPMKVEQRIGRIDRVGQKAAKLTIINFKIADTIEERVYERLHDKLMAFSDSLGDLEVILGKEVERLTIALLSANLTPEQEEEKISQAHRAIETELQNTLQLEEQSSGLIGLSDYVQTKIDEDRGRGRYILTQELESYLSDFFENNFKGTEINYNTPEEGCLRLRLSEDARDSLNGFMAGDKSLAARNLRREVLDMTFSRERMQKFSHRKRSRVIFVNHMSPLIRWVTKCNKDKACNFHKTACVEVSIPELPEGSYLYSIQRWTMKGLTSFEKLAYGIKPLNGDTMLPMLQAESIFQSVFQNGKTWFSNRTFNTAVLASSLENFENEMFYLFDDEVRRHKVENKSLCAIKEQRIRNIFGKRIAEDEQRLATMERNNREERELRLPRGRIKKSKENMEKALSQIALSIDVNESFDTVAMGIFNNVL